MNLDVPFSTYHRSPEGARCRTCRMYGWDTMRHRAVLDRFGIVHHGQCPLVRGRLAGRVGGGAVGLSAEQQELLDKIKALTISRYGAWTKDNAQKLFDSYATAGQANKDQVFQLLADAGVGNFITRPKWRDGVFDAVDKNKDGLISSDEFYSTIRSTLPTDTAPADPVAASAPAPISATLPTGVGPDGMPIAPAAAPVTAGSDATAASGSSAAISSAPSVTVPVVAGVAAAALLAWFVLKD